MLKLSAKPLDSFNEWKNYFCQAGKLFSARIWKMTHVMLRQPHVWASSASPTQKLLGLRVVYSKSFSRATFLCPGELMWWIDIWVICQWNKFGEKVQCEYSACLIYTFSLLFSSSFAFQTGRFTSSYICHSDDKWNDISNDWMLSVQLSFCCISKQMKAKDISYLN